MTKNFSDELFIHGTEERQKHFAQFFTQLINSPSMPRLDATAALQLLAIAALEWPGEEDEQWATLVGMAAYFFNEAMTTGEIDPQVIFEKIGNA